MPTLMIFVRKAVFYTTLPVATLFFAVDSVLAISFNLREATVDSIQAGLSSGATTCTDITQKYLNRIQAYDDQGPSLNAIIATNPNALKIAAELDAAYAVSGPVGSLHCVPVVLKDNYDTFDMPTTAGALALKDFQTGEDAFQVAGLREEGALILAKANLSEFAFSFTSTSSLGGTTVNPYDTTRNAGGSSGGTGAAIAANFGVLGFGTDTGGSIRVPSSFNSLIGVRPTIGLSSRSGIVPLALSQDVGGPMTRTVKDAALALNATVGFDPADPITAGSIGQIPDDYTAFLSADGLSGAKIGLVSALFGSDSNPESVKTTSVIKKAVDALVSLGATVTEVVIPNLSEILAFPSLSSFEFKRDLNAYLAERPVPPSGIRTLGDIIDSGLYLEDFESAYISRNERPAPETDPEYIRIITERPVLTQSSLLKALTGLDALIYPSVTSPPNILGEPLASGAGNRLSPFSGFPAITVPAGFTEDGLPVGLEFLGRAYDEPTLLKLTYAFEQGTLVRRSPTSTPPLAGESIPEPGTAVALIVFAFGTLLIWKRSPANDML
ncbi:MAG: amidase [Phormidesmis priestleyi]|uniref:Amidase n=1 Tax=Phormidesmis priestleyi TaxID=268141 RepID=A0A2W4XCF9_9CYAN|nr:MAG: amidase [Phormidesmis priestleyi]